MAVCVVSLQEAVGDEQVQYEIMGAKTGCASANKQPDYDPHIVPESRPGIL
jgi:hypothetical protein